MLLPDYLKSRQALINEWLFRLIPDEKAFPPTIHKSMRYSLIAGGKRLRPILSIASSEAIGGDLETVLPFACAIEMIHTYSLIHDDLPAMDNDDLRRGRPTCHKVFGEGIAILTGDALLTHAFSILSRPELGGDVDPSTRLKVINELAFASGTEGMIGGQVLDLEAQNMSLDIEDLSTIHRLKTGALIRASVIIGALIGGAKEKEMNALSAFGQYLGLAFQITDDILDLESPQEISGKTQNSDITNNKATYPAILGIKASKKKAKEAADKAVAAIEPFNHQAEALRRIAYYTICRDR
ncbi:polyprenyl synthetase family protein [bacterium]|nr:polyprenyl synthetase family protein [bacterium]